MPKGNSEVGPTLCVIFLLLGRKNMLYLVVQYSSHFQFIINSINFLTFEDAFFLVSVYQRCI